MIIDCHMHFVPTAFPLQRMLAAMESHGIDKAVITAAPSEAFVFGGLLQRAANDFLLFNMFHFNPVGRLLYDMFLLDNKGYTHVLWDKYHIIHRPSNGPVAKAIEKHPDKFLGWIFVDPAVDEDPVSELEKWSALPGMIGAKAHPFYHRYSIDRLDTAAEWCRKNDYPILIHLGSMRGSGDYERLPEKYPGLKIIYAHAGTPYYRKLWAYIKNRKDVYVDLSQVAYVNRNIVRLAVDFLGPDKCLYGSDSPFGRQPMGNDFDFGLTKGWIEDLPLSDKALDKIFHENFEAIRKS